MAAVVSGMAVAFTPLRAAAQNTASLLVNASTGETPAQFAKRTQWWRDGKFGLFIHWGIYSVPADASKGAEWYFNGSKMQVRDYEKFAPQFDPVNFDADRWVRAARDAGMKYIVITSKHHDGFDMYDSKVSDYTIVKSTPFQHDPMKDLAAVCKKYGLRFCFYHSIMDWHQSDYLPRRPWDDRLVGDASLDKYLNYMKAQLRELLTNYGPIGLIWFDGGWEHSAAELRSAEVNKMIRSLQPNILINDRNGLPEDYSTPEQTIPANAFANGRLWETCMTMNGTWGYTKDDHNWKSSEDLIHKLCDIASKGGNFLLNVGPTDKGEFPPEAVERLAAIGKWMKVNGESIYGTTKSPYRRTPFDGRCTTKGDTLYLQVFSWPDAGLKVTGLKTRVRSARALDGRRGLSIAAGSDGPVIARPAKLDPVATVVELKLDGPAAVDAAAWAVKPAADGTMTLTAADADLKGGHLQVEDVGGSPNVGYWTDPKDEVSWTVEVPKDGAYAVEIEYACEPGSAGSTFRVHADGAAEGVEGTVPDTGSWANFRTDSLSGALRLTAGRHVITLTPLAMPHGAVMNLRRLMLALRPIH
jgi:alpha-L-fucosidase